jgi:guanine deaminase
MSDEEFLREAIELAVTSARGGGGPFGAVVVRDGVVIGRGSNRVVPSTDPTAHAEIVAIREAARGLGTHLLAGCTLYASCEPCPMCYAATHWARIERLVHASSREDAAAAGFDDELLHREIALPLASRALPIESMLGEEGRAAFRAWAETEDRTPY